MKRIITLLALILIILSCKQIVKPKLYIIIVTISDRDKEKCSYDTVLSVFEDEYFGIELKSYGGGRLYKAEKYKNESELYTSNNMVFYMVAGEDGKEIEFNDYTEFINYMTERGYKMYNKINGAYGDTYIFKKQQ